MPPHTSWRNKARGRDGKRAVAGGGGRSAMARSIAATSPGELDMTSSWKPIYDFVNIGTILAQLSRPLRPSGGVGASDARPVTPRRSASPPQQYGQPDGLGKT
jgi:hypothetical protein